MTKGNYRLSYSRRVQKTRLARKLYAIARKLLETIGY